MRKVVTMAACLASLALAGGLVGVSAETRSAAEHENAALSAAAHRQEALPSKPSEEHIQILTDTTVTNSISKMSQAARASEYQMALESARKLRAAKELKRAESTLIQILESGAPDSIKRPALLELALVMQEQKSYPKAQQLYSEYVRRFEKDPSIPEVLLRQAYLYREMGVPVLAQSKFYAVISTCLNLKLDDLEYYQRLVLRAQAEIAETHFLQGNYEEAIDYFNRLLRLESVDLERANVIYKLVHCYMKRNQLDEVMANARLFLEKFPRHIDAPETRFMLIDALKKVGQNREAIEELDTLLSTQRADAETDPQQWLYWQQRAGNTIANQFYREGDFISALRVYEALAGINATAEWQMPVWYQMGLIYEHLKQPQKACEIYDKVATRLKDSKEPTAGLTAVADMAAWRKKNLEWEKSAKEANKQVAENEPASAG